MIMLLVVLLVVLRRIALIINNNTQCRNWDSAMTSYQIAASESFDFYKPEKWVELLFWKI